MLSRHFLRAKALQSLYAVALTDSNDLRKTEQTLLNNISKLYDLFIYQLSSLTALLNFAEKSIEEGKQKYFPTEEEKNPDLRFVQNRVGEQLANNHQFQKDVLRLKINWQHEEDMFRIVYGNFKNTEAYRSFMTLEKVTYADEQQVMLSLFKELMNYEPMEAFFTEKNLLWEEDYYQIAQLAYKALKELSEEFGEEDCLPRFFEPNEEGEANEDKQFVVDLLRKTVLHNEEYEELIKKRLENWTFDRIALLDLIILKMALTEFLHFSSIPVKVTINEYVELAKEFSTSKSKIFVNGLLDKLIVDLRVSGQLKKMGRGLITDSRYDREDDELNSEE